MANPKPRPAQPLATFLAATLLAWIAAWSPASLTAQIDAFPGVEPLPVEFQKEGVLFRVRNTNPAVSSIYVVGTHNGWGGQFHPNEPVDANDRMYGPTKDGIFELYYPLAPGTYAYMFSLNGDFGQRLHGHPSSPKAEEFFKVVEGETIHNLRGSILQFGLDEPPWPPILETTQMMPAIVVRDAKPYLRVRYYNPSADIVHLLGSWNDWKGAGGVTVADDSQRMRESPINGLYDILAGPLSEGEVQYKLVVDRKNWLSDPVVEETNSHGNSIIQVVREGNTWTARYTPRFDPKAPRQDWEWDTGQIDWIARVDEGFRQAEITHQPVFWVITLPGSKPSEDFIAGLDGDEVLRSRLKKFIPLKTDAHEVREFLREKRIVRLPHVIIADKTREIRWQQSLPDLLQVGQAISQQGD